MHELQNLHLDPEKARLDKACQKGGGYWGLQEGIYAVTPGLSERELTIKLPRLREGADNLFKPSNG